MSDILGVLLVTALVTAVVVIGWDTARLVWQWR